MKIIKKNSVEQQTQTDEEDDLEIQSNRGRKSSYEDNTEHQTLNENEEDVSKDVRQHDENTENVLEDENKNSTDIKPEDTSETSLFKKRKGTSNRLQR